MGGKRKFHNGELHNFYSSPNVIRVNKLVRWAGHEACMGAEKNLSHVLLSCDTMLPTSSR
jgi:hypothetical protein